MGVQFNQHKAAIGDIGDAVRSLQTAIERLESVEVTPSASSKIDYTAALEKELMKLCGKGSYDINDVSVHHIATRLNAAIQKQHCAKGK